MPKKSKKKKNKPGILQRLFPAWFTTDKESNAVDLPAAGAMMSDVDTSFIDMLDPAAKAALGLPGDTLADEAQKAQAVGKLPADRLGRYKIYDEMVEDAIIHSALQAHTVSAFSAALETSEICGIESVSDKDDPIVNDLRDTFKETINSKIRSWGYNTALWGCYYGRQYGQPGKGVGSIRDDYYTHPAHIKEYEQAGRLAGYSSAYQNPVRQGRIMLIEPWKFLSFKMPKLKTVAKHEPIRLDGKEIDIASDYIEDEGLIETSNYGTSLLEAAYEPWFDLREAILAMNMSRKNAARLERLVFLQMAGLSTQEASKYRNMVAKYLDEASKANTRESMRRGYVQTMVNTIIPMLGQNNKGRWETANVEGNPNIDGIEDIMFHAKRLAAALGTDLSLIGFADEQSGAFGEGGWARTSILTAAKSTMIREAVDVGLEQMFCLHVLWKHGKYFLPGQRPWRRKWNSVDSALEREQSENLDLKINQATLFATLLQTGDPNMETGDRQAIMNYLCTDMMGMDEEKFKGMFPKKKPASGNNGDGGGMGFPGAAGGGENRKEGQVMESVAGPGGDGEELSHYHIMNIIRRTVDEALMEKAA